MAQTIRASDLNIAGIKHNKIEPKGKGKFVKMTKENGDAIRIQIPNAQVPFGLSTYENETDGSKKYSLEISLGGNPKIEAFLEQLEEIDELNINTIVSNSEAWLGKQKSKTVVEEASYGSLIKLDKKGVSPSRFKVKLPIWEDKPLFSVFEKGSKVALNIVDTDEDGTTTINWDWAQNRMEISVVAVCEGFWVVGKNVYCTWRADQIKINKKGTSGVEYAFLDEEEEDVAEETKEVTEEDSALSDEEVSDEEVSGSGAESGAEEE